jgi:hypothetical protein
MDQGRAVADRNPSVAATYRLLDAHAATGTVRDIVRASEASAVHRWLPSVASGSVFRTSPGSSGSRAPPANE